MVSTSNVFIAAHARFHDVSPRDGRTAREKVSAITLHEFDNPRRATMSPSLDDDDDDVRATRETMTSSSTSSLSLVDRINALLREDASGRVVSVQSLPGERERFERRLRAFRYAATRERDTNDCVDASSSSSSMAIEMDALEETMRFWRALAEDESNATRALMSLLQLALSGRRGVDGMEGTNVSSARELARAYRPKGVDEEAELSTTAKYRTGDAMTAWSAAANFGSGFVAGLGGSLTLPVTIPAQLAATTFTTLRLSFALAILAGRDPLDPECAATAIACALGGDDLREGDDLCRRVGGSVDEATQYAAIRGSGTALQGAAWRLTRLAATRLAQRGAQRGASMAVTRAVPILGGVIGGTVDGAFTQSAGSRAMRAFFPPRPSSVSTFEETVKRSKDEAVANVKDAAETAAKSLRDAFERVSVSIKSSIERTTTSMDAGFRGKDSLEERLEREREIEDMRAVLEDGYVPVARPRETNASSVA